MRKERAESVSEPKAEEVTKNKNQGKKKAIQAGKNRTKRDGEGRMSGLIQNPQPLLLGATQRSDRLNRNVREASKSKARSTSLLLQSQHAAVDEAIPSSLSETDRKSVV